MCPALEYVIKSNQTPTNKQNHPDISSRQWSRGSTRTAQNSVYRSFNHLSRGKEKIRIRQPEERLDSEWELSHTAQAVPRMSSWRRKRDGSGGLISPLRLRHRAATDQQRWDQDELICTNGVCLRRRLLVPHLLTSVLCTLLWWSLSYSYVSKGGTGKFPDLPELQQLISGEHLLSK